MRSHVSQTCFANVHTLSLHIRSHASCIQLLILGVSMLVLLRILVSVAYTNKTQNTSLKLDSEPPQRYVCDWVGGIADYLVTGGASFIGSALVKII